MEMARKALVVLLWLYVLGVLVQFFLAGLGMAELGNKGMDVHRGLGFSLAYLPIIFLVVAAVAKLPKPTLIMMAAFAVVAIVQPFWASEFQGESIAALHVLGAAFILAMSHALARLVMRQAGQRAE